MNNSLFAPKEPLASRIRPDSLNGFVGQDKLVGENGPIRKFIESGEIPSMIFWGPPGCGKTTLANILANQLDYMFFKISAVMSGKAKLKEIIKKAFAISQTGKKSILFIDEIHRWSKLQQDALLPYVEKGLITLIGATTENPSFTVISALLSRSKVFVFDSHSEEEIENYLSEITKIEFPEFKFEEESLRTLANFSNGDIRQALSGLETSVNYAQKSKLVTKKTVENVFQKVLLYDKQGEEHYNIISAIHKSMRSSDENAAVYWTMRMLEGGEDPLYLARRMLRFSAEDIGNADPQAVILANSVFDSCKKIGLPECKVFLVQLAIYLSRAPKDNSAYIAEGKAKEDIQAFGNLPVPMNIRNAPTQLMKDLNYGKGYIYDHNTKNKKSEQQCLPDKLIGRKYINSIDTKKD